MEAFYELLGGEHVRSTEHTAGPWSPEAQHFGPPAALLTRALEGCEPQDGALLGRITVEILGPVPIADLRVAAEVSRPGRSVQLLTATLSTAERPVARASAWRFARTDTSAQSAGAAAPLPAGARPRAQEPLTGYLGAMEWAHLSGGFEQPGPAQVWMRQRVPLVAGEDPTPLQRLMAVADSASGVSSRLDMRSWLFINTELTVHVQRPPAGEWIGLDADTVIGPDGAGTAMSVLHDERGQVGNSAQALLVRPR
ncbi:thioesterase family protein [Salinifilum ghardaiensis]